MAKKNPKQDYSIDWILRDRRVIDGLDHLGIELVSVNFYQTMLPGLTNVTERARYYSFYLFSVKSCCLLATVIFPYFFLMADATPAVWRNDIYRHVSSTTFTI